VTAGPTYEPLDNVRRLTNFSTGSLGAQLAAFLTDAGHEVTLLVGEMATYRGERKAKTIRSFTTTQDLRDLLKAAAQRRTAAVFHAAAVSDFSFGKLWHRKENSELVEVSGGKISTREGNLLAELRPTAKIIAELRGWFPETRLVGWKYEVDGTRVDVLQKAERQLAESRTDVCVANGPAYGKGFGFLRSNGELTHLATRTALFEALAALTA
jgi:phosphopantothenoylcysteine decarboxylase/phosphopantothenate--cysteine ligase